MNVSGVKLTHIIFTVLMGILVLVMSGASCQFIKQINKDSENVKNEDRSLTLQPIKIEFEDIDSNRNKQGNIRILTVSELNRIMDSINSKILDKQAQIIKRQEDLINDIRQETNNNIDKHSAWLAFWITILGFVGVVSPIAYQMMQTKSLEEKVVMQAKTLEEKVEGTRRNFEKIQEAYTLKMEMLSFETILNNNLEYTTDLRRLYIDSVKRHFKEFVSLVDIDVKKWEDEKIHICNVLVNLNSFLNRLLLDAQYDEQRRIRDVIDRIQTLLSQLPTSLKYSQIEERLRKVESTLTKI